MKVWNSRVTYCSWSGSSLIFPPPTSSHCCSVPFQPKFSSIREPGTCSFSIPKRSGRDNVSEMMKSFSFTPQRLIWPEVQEFSLSGTKWTQKTNYSFISVLLAAFYHVFPIFLCAGWMAAAVQTGPYAPPYRNEEFLSYRPTYSLHRNKCHGS